MDVNKMKKIIVVVFVSALIIPFQNCKPTPEAASNDGGVIVGNGLYGKDLQLKLTGTALAVGKISKYAHSINQNINQSTTSNAFSLVGERAGGLLPQTNVEKIVKGPTHYFIKGSIDGCILLAYPISGGPGFC